MGNIINNGLNAIEYNYSVRPSVDNLLNPIKDLLNVSNFIYMKVLRNGNILHLSTNHQWAMTSLNLGIFENNMHLQKLINETKVGQSQIFLRYGKPQNKVLSSLQEAGLWNGVSFCKKYEHFFEVFAFFSNLELESNMNFYVNNVSKFERYILYFKDKADTLISCAHDNAYIKSPTSYDWSNSEPDLMKTFIENTKLDNYFFSNKNEKVHITVREMEIIYCLSCGMTYKEIGNKLGISFRTVETHIQNVKKRLDFPTTDGIIKCFWMSDYKTYFNLLN